MTEAASRLVSASLTDSLPWRDPLAAFAPLATEPYALLLHDGQNGRARIFAFPDRVFEGEGRESFDALAEAGRALPEGVILAGLLGYELGQAFERLPETGQRWPALAFGQYPAWAEFDADASSGAKSVAGEIRIHGHDPAARERLRSALGEAGSLEPAPDRTARGWQARWSRERYLQAARRARDYVHAGDVFQVNLSQAFDARLAADDTPFAAFQRLCRQSPAPHAAFLALDTDRIIVSNSPERFLRVADRQVEARPIKGTRPRDPDPQVDASLALELEASAKDRAENLMIVDLMRNDLSRICQTGSVRVPVLCEIESYANVHHLVSVVEGEIAPDRDVFDLISASFPPGSITGAPKVRAMEIISELEAESRGAYCGALGWIDANGDLDLNVMIRTAALRRADGDWLASIRSGGGIVADSDPASEYEETLTKVSALKRALGAGG